MMPNKGKEPANASHVIMGQRSKWLGLSGGIKRRVALSCDAAGLGAPSLVPTTLRQFSRDRPTMGSHVAGDSRGGDLDVGGPDVGGSDVGGPDLGDRDKERRLLETNFWDSEDSEDEGIGSDDSVEHADMSPVQESPVKSLNWAVDKRKVSGRRRRGVGGILTQIRKSFQGKAEQGGLVFGVGLGELVTSEGGKVPQLVTWATELIEQRGAEACEGIYRLSLGGSSKLKTTKTRKITGCRGNQALWPLSELLLMPGSNRVTLTPRVHILWQPCSKFVDQHIIVFCF